MQISEKEFRSENPHWAPNVPQASMKILRNFIGIQV